MLSTSHTRPESARPPSRLMSANAARRAIAQLDHITPSAHYTAVGDSPFATSLDHRQVKRWHSVPGVENSPLYFCQSSSFAVVDVKSSRSSRLIGDPDFEAILVNGLWLLLVEENAYQS